MRLMIHSVPRQRRVLGREFVRFITALSILPLAIGYIALGVYLVADGSVLRMLSTPTAQADSPSIAYLSENSPQIATESHEVGVLWNCEGNYTERPDQFQNCVEINPTRTEKGNKLRSFTPQW